MIRKCKYYIKGTADAGVFALILRSLRLPHVIPIIGEIVYSSIHPRLDLLQQQTRKGVPVLDNTLQLLLFMIPRYSLALKGKQSHWCILGPTWGFFQQGQGILTILLRYQGIATQSHSWGPERRSIVR